MTVSSASKGRGLGAKRLHRRMPAGGDRSLPSSIRALRNSVPGWPLLAGRRASRVSPFGAMCMFDFEISSEVSRTTDPAPSWWTHGLGEPQRRRESSQFHGEGGALPLLGEPRGHARRPAERGARARGRGPSKKASEPETAAKPPRSPSVGGQSDSSPRRTSTPQPIAKTRAAILTQEYGASPTTRPDVPWTSTA